MKCCSGCGREAKILVVYGNIREMRAIDAEMCQDCLRDMMNFWDDGTIGYEWAYEYEWL